MVTQVRTPETAPVLTPLSGEWEAVREAKLAELREHVARLDRSCQALQTWCPYGAPQIETAEYLYEQAYNRLHVLEGIRSPAFWLSVKDTPAEDLVRHYCPRCKEYVSVAAHATAQQTGYCPSCSLDRAEGNWR